MIQVIDHVKVHVVGALILQYPGNCHISGQPEQPSLAAGFRARLFTVYKPGDAEQVVLIPVKYLDSVVVIICDVYSEEAVHLNIGG
jgi:hypothetical protein